MHKGTTRITNRLRSTFTHRNRAARMVAALGPGKFYGSSLPRPRIYTEVKLNDERIDPPLPVMDPLMKWAQDAHWSMGGLSFTRHRLQGRIEGSVNKLRLQRESHKQQEPVNGSTASGIDKGKSLSPPPAPMANKRRRVVGLLDEDEDEEEEEEMRVTNTGAARKLNDDFERAAKETGVDGQMVISGGRKVGGMAAARARSEGNEQGAVVNKGIVNERKKRLVKGGRKVGATVVAAASRIRSSPRLGKIRGLC